jgi:hypothetical protein
MEWRLRRGNGEPGDADPDPSQMRGQSTHSADIFLPEGHARVSERPFGEYESALFAACVPTRPRPRAATDRVKIQNQRRGSG